MPRFKKTSDPHASREAERYSNPIPSRKYILELVSGEGPLTERQITKALALKGQERRHALRKRLNAMQRDGQILCNRAGEYGVVDKMDLIAGKVEAHRDGFGYLLREGEPDIYLPAFQMRQVIHGDEVLVSPVGENRRGQPEGKVVEILARHTERVVGRLALNEGEAYLIPDNPRISHDIMVNADDLGVAKPGDYAIVLLTKQPGLHQRARGVIVERLGAPMAPGLEIDVAIHRYELPHIFPDACLAELEPFGSEPSARDKKGRHDLRQLPLVTIDGEDARDFDDAVYCEKQKDSSYRLWVAIADVAHYVAVNSALDTEASQRGTSVYFPGKVVPMLPEQISNGLCSLNPRVDRLCMVCEMHISGEGELQQYSFYEAVMHSKARLTYMEVAEVLGLLERPARADVASRLKNVLPHLTDLYSLYKTLTKARAKRGAIEFESTETQIVFNEHRKIEEIVPVVRNEAHRIIEESMLCANVAAADFLTSHTLDALYRVHEGPKPEKLKNLRSYLGPLGLELKGSDEPEPRHYQVLMNEIAERADAHLIQIMLLRSMNQAVYQPENKGHFGLAYKAYAHFTSPIRRYPDLLVHRAIKSIIRSRRKSEAIKRIKGTGVLTKSVIYPYQAQDMVAIGLHCSMTERRADEAARDVIAWLKCEYLQAHLGTSFMGVITGVTGFGFFVELSDLFVEGLVHISSIGGDYFHCDMIAQVLVGERTGLTYRMGDTVTVTVSTVDLVQRRIDLELAGQSKNPKERSNGRRPVARKRSKASKESGSQRGKRKQPSSGKSLKKVRKKSSKGKR